MRIATLNLRHNNDRWEERFPLVVEALAAAQADVVGLQEVWLGIDQAHMIAESLRERGLVYDVCVEAKWGPNPVEGIALLSRLPIIEKARLELPEGNRVAQRITVEIDGKRVNIANTHLHHQPRDESIRLPQMAALLTWMHDYNRDRWLLTGDMNALPESATISAARQKLQSAYRDAHGNEPVTFPTPLVTDDYPPVCIDYIFFDAATLRVGDIQVMADNSHPDDDTLYPSDHYGLAADITIL
jgi:endonuclease/exonuclease/phosphatase family metal-dependent hydrolase